MFEITWKTFFFKDIPADVLYEFIQLRERVFVVEQNCVYLDCDGKDRHAVLLLGYVGDSLVAGARLLPEGISYEGYTSLGRIVSNPDYRRKGMGVALMHAALDYLDRFFPDHPCKISAQCYLLDFYRKFGFEAIGEPYLEDDIPHQAMIRPKP